jgi:integrase
VHHVHTVLHTALAQAVRWGYVARNVADAVDPPAVPRQELRTLTPEEVGRLLAAARGTRLEALWTVAVCTGCREGELLGLRWEDVDWQAPAVLIQRTLTRAPLGEPVFAEPKTAGSRRAVPLPAVAEAALRDHQARQEGHRRALGPDYADYGLVFATRLGTALQARNVIRSFKGLLEPAGLPRALRVHDLRHTTASLLLALGTDVPTTAAILGHAQSSTTLNVYAHALPSRLSTAADRLGEAIRREQGEPPPQPPPPTRPSRTRALEAREAAAPDKPRGNRRRSGPATQRGGGGPERRGADPS